MTRLDLHTHSVASPDGGLRERDYARMLQHGGLHAVAVTDHDRIDFAQALQAELGDRIIVGEEIKAREGELIGLYLHERIPPGMSAADTIAAIQAQDGLVYLPHPFETVRSGLPAEVVDELADTIDIIEIANGRAVFQNRSVMAKQYQRRYGWAGSAASDAHTRTGWGRTYTSVAAEPTRASLVELLQAATYTVKLAGPRGLAAPKLNRLRKRLRRA